MTAQFSVTKNGKPFTDYHWCEKTKTFCTTESRLVIDFSGVHGVTFKTGDSCTFNTGYGCTFNTGSYCTFKTGPDCTFNTGSACTFNTGYGCTFKTGSDCTFKTGHECTFKAGKNCVGIRYDVDGIIEIPKNTTIKYNDQGIPGYEVIKQAHTITIDGKEIELSEESYQSLKKLLITD